MQSGISWKKSGTAYRLKHLSLAIKHEAGEEDLNSPKDVGTFEQNYFVDIFIPSGNLHWKCRKRKESA